MKYLKIAILATLILGTSASWAQKSIARSPKVQWISAFKEYVTYKCICEMTNGKIDSLLYKTNDFSYGIQREILMNFADTADSLGRKFARRIPLISDEPGSDLYGYKSWFTDCIYFGQSTEIDSAAKAEYKQFKKLERKSWWYIK